MRVGKHLIFRGAFRRGDDEAPPPDAVWVAAPVQMAQQPLVPPPLAPQPMSIHSEPTEFVPEKKDPEAYYRCPQCGRRNPITMKRCRCGCEMPASDQMAAAIKGGGVSPVRAAARVAHEEEAALEETVERSPFLRNLALAAVAAGAVLLGFWALHR